MTNRGLFLACLCPLRRWRKFSTPFIRSDEVKQCNIRPNIFTFDAFKKKYTILFVASNISSLGNSIWLLYKRERYSILFARREDDFSSSFCKNFDLLIFSEKVIKHHPTKNWIKHTVITILSKKHKQPIFLPSASKKSRC